MATSRIRRMGTPLRTTGGEFSRPELLAVCRLQRPTDDRPTCAGHPDPFVLCPTVQFSTVAMLTKEGDQAGEEVAQLGGTGLLW